MSDLRDALRSLRATPVVSAVAILSLALGIGANTAIFSLLDSVMLRSLPVHEPQRPGRCSQDRLLDQPHLGADPRSAGPLRDGAFAWSHDAVQPRRRAARASSSTGSGPAAASSRCSACRRSSAARSRRRRRAAAAGRTGRWRSSATGSGSGASAARPTSSAGRSRSTACRSRSSASPGRTSSAPTSGRTFDVVDPDRRRAAAAAGPERARPALVVVAERHGAAEAGPDGRAGDRRAARRPAADPRGDAAGPLASRGLKRVPEGTVHAGAGGDGRVRRCGERYERPILVLMIVVALVLLIACANIANLLLARADGAAPRAERAARARRLARRLARQLLAESLVLAGAGAALGLAFARWGSALLVRQLSTPTNKVFLDMPLDWRVLGFTTAVAVATALLFGTVPALRASRVEPNEALKEQGRGGSAPPARGRRPLARRRRRSRSRWCSSSPPGCSCGRSRRSPTATSASTASPCSSSPSTRSAAARRWNGRTDLFERVHQAAARGPGRGACGRVGRHARQRHDLEQPGRHPRRPAAVRGGSHHEHQLVTPGWFATYGTRLLAGRDVRDRDRQGAPAVALVNETFVRKFVGRRPAIGRTLRQQGRPGKAEPPIEIVGVVDDAVYRSLREPVPPTMYLPLAQVDASEAMAVSSVSLSVRAARGSPGALARPVLAAVRAWIPTSPSRSARWPSR